MDFKNFDFHKTEIFIGSTIFAIAIIFEKIFSKEKTLIEEKLNLLKSSQTEP